MTTFLRLEVQFSERVRFFSSQGSGYGSGFYTMALCSMYVVLFCLKWNFFGCEIFLLHLIVMHFCQNKNILRIYLGSNLKKVKNIEAQRKLWYSYK